MDPADVIMIGLRQLHIKAQLAVLRCGLLPAHELGCFLCHAGKQSVLLAIIKRKVFSKPGLSAATNQTDCMVTHSWQMPPWQSTNRSHRMNSTAEHAVL